MVDQACSQNGRPTLLSSVDEMEDSACFLMCGKGNCILGEVHLALSLQLNVCFYHALMMWVTLFAKIWLFFCLHSRDQFLFSHFQHWFVELSLYYEGIPHCHLCLLCDGSGLSPEWESNFAIIWKVEQCAMYIVIPLFGNFRLLCMEFYFNLSEASMTFLLSRIIGASNELTAYPSGKTLTCWYLPSMVVLIMHWHFLFVWYVGYDCSMNMFSCLGNCGSTILYWQWTRKTTE